MVGHWEDAARKRKEAMELLDDESNALQSFFPKDSPVWFAVIGLLLFFTIVWLFVRRLEKESIYLRV